MVPSLLPAFLARDGRLVGLPYFTAFYTTRYNDILIKKYGITKFPKTWDEMHDQCMELKKAGVKYPFCAFWTKEYHVFSESFFAMAYSESDKDPLFDEKGEPTMADGGVALKVLEWMKQMYDDGLTNPAYLTNFFESLNAWWAGENAYTLFQHYFMALDNNPESSKIAGNVKLMEMPGSTGGSYAFNAAYVMTTMVRPGDRLRAWDLMRFLGGRNKEGQFYSNKKWMLTQGLLCPYKPLLTDPEVLESFNKWCDARLLFTLFEKSRTRVIGAEEWFAEWNDDFMTQCHMAITGEKTPQKALEDSSEKAKTLKKEYG
jgi:multiple sugar transport system substrate-binding protein